MGLLDSVFAGANGVSSMLHDMFGATAAIRTRTYTRDETTGILVESVSETPVTFVPANEQDSKTALNAPRTGRNDVREPADILSGTFPCASLSAKITPERDTIVVGGIEYQIETADLLTVGEAEVQYSITARRIGAASIINNETEGTETDGN